MAKALLSVSELRAEYNLGRDLAAHIIKLLPNIWIGHAGRAKRLLVRRSDVDRLMEKAIHDQRSLWEIVRSSTATTLEVWLHNEVQ